jgi:hypothetical protein
MVAPHTPYLGIPTPTENEDPFFATMVNHFRDVDLYLTATRENAGAILIKDGSPWSLVGPDLSWGDIELTSAESGEAVTAAAGTMAIAGDGVVYVQTGDRPFVDQVSAVQFAETLPINARCYVLGVVRAGAFYPHKAGGGGMVGGAGMIYVDAANGTAGGDGSPGAPFDTLVNAAASVGAPADWAEFHDGALTFVLAPGTYTGDVTLPRRQIIAITGSHAIIVGNLITEFRLADWFGEDPYASILNAARLMIGASDGDFTILAGNVTFQNVTPAAGVNGPPHGFYANKLFHVGSILNLATDGSEVDATTGMLFVGIDGSQNLTTASRIFGDRETTGALTEDYVVLSMRATLFYGTVCGCIMHNRWTDSYIRRVRWDEDAAGNPFLGTIGSAPVDALIANCNFAKNAGPLRSAFGWDGFTGGGPNGVVIDANSEVSYVNGNGIYENITVNLKDKPLGMYFDQKTNGTGSFADTATAGYAVEPYNLQQFINTVQQRGAAYSPDATVHVRHGGDAAESGLYLLAALAQAKLLTPGGQPLSAQNRARVVVQPGRYFLDIGNALYMDTEFVDVIGEGSCAYNDQTGETPGDGVVIEGQDRLVWWKADDATLQGVTLHAGAGWVGVNSLNMIHWDAPLNNGRLSLLRGILFTKDGTVAASQVKALYGTDFDGTLVDCVCGTDVDGLAAGTFNGAAYRCHGGHGSFGGWYWSGYDMAETGGYFSGYAVDCSAGWYSFGASNYGEGLFTGSTWRCKASAHSFGSGTNLDQQPGPVTIPREGRFAGLAIECDARAYSWGYTTNGTGHCLGTARRCTGAQFCFGAGYSYGGGTVRCAGALEDCRADSDSFGSDQTDPTASLCGGRLTRCEAYLNSFGYTGMVEDGALLEDCVAMDLSFGNTVAAQVAHFLRCRSLNRTVPVGVHGAVVDGCRFHTTAPSGATPVLVNGHATVTRFYRNEIQAGDGVSPCINGAAPATNVTTALNILNVALGANLVNTVAAPGDVVDPTLTVM